MLLKIRSNTTRLMFALWLLTATLSNLIAQDSTTTKDFMLIQDRYKDIGHVESTTKYDTYLWVTALTRTDLISKKKIDILFLSLNDSDKTGSPENGVAIYADELPSLLTALNTIANDVYNKPAPPKTEYEEVYFTTKRGLKIEISRGAKYVDGRFLSIWLDKNNNKSQMRIKPDEISKLIEIIKSSGLTN